MSLRLAVPSFIDMHRASAIAVVLGILSAGSAAVAQDRQDVTFQINYSQTVVGQSVFVLGDIAELGGGDIRKAVKLEPSQWPNWKVTLGIPSGITYTYRYVRRDDGPGRLGDTTNQVLISGPFTQTASGGPAASDRKAILLHSTLASPTLNWRTVTALPAAGAFTQSPMIEAGPGRTANERRWLAANVSHQSRTIEFFFTGPGGIGRDPASGVYSTTLDGCFVRDGQVYGYVPSPTVTDWRRDYNPSALPAIQSQFLFENSQREWREYRVILPRGYDQHPARRYPVVYLHDGQNVFEAGPFGTWNAHIAAGTLVRAGQMREAILVGIDNGPNRLSDYSAPDAGGNANNYVRFLREELMPLINANYRTLTGPDNTATIGSSMGGQVSLYMGWDYPTTFRRIGAFSGAWSVFTSGFINRVQSQPRRDILLYIDSGDAGTASDNYWPTFNLRDNLLARAGTDKFVFERDLKHVIGWGQQHNEAAWAARLPDAYRFLLPPVGDPALLALANGSLFDRSGDGQLTIDDLYEQILQPADLNLDGTADDADTSFLERLLRSNEAQDMRTPQR